MKLIIFIIFKFISFMTKYIKIFYFLYLFILYFLIIILNLIFNLNKFKIKNIINIFFKYKNIIK